MAEAATERLTMSQELNERITDWAQWYKAHEEDGRSIEQEVLFLKKTVDGLFECLAIAARDIQEHHSANAPEEVISRLYRPNGMVLRR
jgi:hypothetical protein